MLCLRLTDKRDYRWASFIVRNRRRLLGRKATNTNRLNVGGRRPQNATKIRIPSQVSLPVILGFQNIVALQLVL